MKRLFIVLILILFSTSIVTAQECLHGDCQNGFGKLKTPAGVFYGFFEAGTPVGPCTYMENTGRVIHGYMYESALYGVVVVLESNGLESLAYMNHGEYAGKKLNIVNNKPVLGQNMQAGQLIADYSTQFLDQEKKGDCTGICKDGVGSEDRKEGFYIGFFDSKKPAFGKLKYSSGDSYYGEFKRGAPDFSGVTVSASGNVYNGGWRKGERHGLGYMLDSQGNVLESGVYNKGEWDRGVDTNISEHLIPLDEFVERDFLSQELADAERNIIRKSIIHSVYNTMVQNDVEDHTIGMRLAPYFNEVAESDLDKLVDILEPYASQTAFFNGVIEHLPRAIRNSVQTRIERSGAASKRYAMNVAIPGYGTCQACNGSGRTGYTASNTYYQYSHMETRIEYDQATQKTYKNTYSVSKPITVNSSGKARCINCQGYGVIKQ